ncbi:hypothetical protein [Nonomuraea helvata]|uniref:Uncharacterized protein n=1 Tax=Nonomuraea helvata TaxID=37484 RepID=A0ABV5S5Z4_9ACTN
MSARSPFEYLHYLTTVTIRLAGEYETKVLPEPQDGRIHVLMPGLLVIVQDAHAALSMAGIWRAATRQAETIFNGRRAEQYRVLRRITSHTSVCLTGLQNATETYGRAHPYSTSRCGELAVQVGGVTVICDDRAAFDVQVQMWQAAAAAVETVWPGKYQR